MKHKLTYSSLLVVALLLTLSQSAAAISMWYVDGIHGSDQNNCRTPLTACKTIHHAISLASSGDSIFVSPATYPENGITITFNLTIVGVGVQTPIIDGGSVNTAVTVSNANAHVTLSNLTIQNGFARFGGGINNSGTLAISNSTITQNTAHYLGCGGGIYNTGALIVNRSTISQNSALGSVLRPASGGGICNDGTATINNSTLSGNYALYLGGGIQSGGTLTINNSTISGNMTGLTFPSAISAIGSERTTTINNSTISGNTHYVHLGCTIGGSGVTLRNTTISGNVAGSGYVVLCATATLQNSIIGNNSGGNCGSGVVSNGYNLSSDNTCNFHQPGDLNNTNPLLGPLQNNGGPTQTMALQSGSPAIDAGNPSGCTDGSGHLLTTDQRGMPRPDHEDTGGCDMGAYERQTD